MSVVFSAVLGAAVCAQESPEELARQLAELGPRAPGDDGHRRAQSMLLKAMEDSGLDAVQSLSTLGSSDWTHLTGTLPGTSTARTILSAHYDTVAGSHGRLDNASGCGVALAAARELGAVPRHRALQVLLTDGEEESATGSRLWLADVPVEERRRILANLNLDMVGSLFRQGHGILHLTVSYGRGSRVLTPAWLVYAVLRSAEVSGLSVSVLDPHWSWFAQLAVRCATPTRVSDSRRFLEAGIPSLTLSDLVLTAEPGHHSRPEDSDEELDGERLDAWVTLVMATIRRLDALTDRPAADTEYLVMGGRVWVRRDLVWAGFVLWVLLVWRGLPGAWSRRSADDRRRSGRGYLPGFAFRMLFLVAVFTIPTFATLLLIPAGLLALAGTRLDRRARLVICWLGAAPTLAFALWLTAGQMRGWFTLDRGALLPATLILLNLATFFSWFLSDSRPNARALGRSSE